MRMNDGHAVQTGHGAVSPITFPTPVHSPFPSSVGSLGHSSLTHLLPPERSERSGKEMRERVNQRNEKRG